MKPVTKYQSDDGKTYDTELEATRADAAYYKERTEMFARIARTSQEDAHHEPGYHLDRGGHM